MSSYSEPNGSETEGSSSRLSGDDISETSKYRAFVEWVGKPSPYSHRSSGSSGYSHHCPSMHDNSCKLNEDIVLSRCIDIPRLARNYRKAPLPNALFTRTILLLYSVRSYDGPGSIKSHM
ncbi:unnamed protein product [Penicillium salamii]|nr:unnamed protein product [Penicillium salamii]CAG8429126.1 unnamed protein product [Penicillium salamii]